MRAVGRSGALLLAMLVLAACSGSGGDKPSSKPTPGDQSGGILRVAMESDLQAALDPAKEYEAVAAELFRCCLLRTLLSYEGVPTGDGGSELHPDIASGLPTVSEDGLTWTFSLKRGIHYGPPFEHVEVTAGDFVRTLEREADRRANIGGYSFYFSVIEGFDQYSAGKASTISGVEAPDDRTLEIRLIEPTGDLGYRFALAATAPIPPTGDSPMGAAEGHEKDYGRFLVSTGPYMLEGSPELDFSLPIGDQQPSSGYVPGRSMTLVRNPSWDASSDPLRPANIDGIQITFGGNNADLENKVRTGDLDLVLDGSVPPAVLRDYSADPSLGEHLHVNPDDSVSYLEFNVLQPPFDDVHVRKAVNLVLDKEGMRTLLGGESKGELTDHIMPNSLENGLLDGYDPYATPDSKGDPDAARREMALSRYADAGGRCTDPVCEGVLAFTVNQQVYQEQAALIADNLKEIGITLDVQALETSTMYAKCADPAEHMGICLALGWSKDYADGYTFAVPLFSSVSIFPSCCNDPLVGASPDLIKENGYPSESAPNVDPLLAKCAASVGEDRFACWAELDRQLMEEVVPWVPWLVRNGVWITSGRVTNYSFDQSSSYPALDRLALVAGTS